MDALRRQLLHLVARIHGRLLQRHRGLQPWLRIARIDWDWTHTIAFQRICAKTRTFRRRLALDVLRRIGASLRNELSGRTGMCSAQRSGLIKGAACREAHGTYADARRNSLANLKRPAGCRLIEISNASWLLSK